MKIPMLFALSLAVLACYAEAKSVLAHFMVGNTAHYNQALWEDEMQRAAASGIDAFALNIANGEAHNYVQLDLAFKAAAARSFKLLFSFDYAGGVSPWTKETVLDLLRTYAGRGTYVQHKGTGLPLVSTFEGPDFADDWNWIKASFKVFFVPDWSSKGAKIAVGLGGGVADGLFNWAAWPDQPNWPKETYIDASYAVALKGKPYMMPVSPWFYTNMPGFDKNWMWRGEMLWYDRWVQTLHVQPEWVQIISWNDYGESHYIGPIRGEQSLVAFGDNYGKSPFNYVRGIEHGGWRIFLPHMISLYKTGTATVTQEGLNVWYRLHPKSAGCKDSGTTAYTATHMQVERPWPEGNRDGVFFAALLGSSASAHVTIGGTVFNPSWRYFPEGGVGVYVGWVETQATGTVKVEIKRGANVVVSLTGDRPIGGCQDGYFNFNPVVYATQGPTIAAKSPPVVINKDTPCVAGNGIGDFQDLCQNACKFNYCPLEACMCTKWGKQQGTDIVRGPPGYPAAGRSTDFDGLCAVTCSYGSAGICPPSKCGMVKLPPIVASVSPFTAKSCTSGHALPTVAHDQAARDKICAFGCKYGYCPTEICVCDSVGTLILPQDVGVQYTGDKPGFKSSLVGIRLLCKYTCGWGVCPAPVCKLPSQVPAPTSPDGGCRKGTGPGGFAGLCDFSCGFGYCPEPCSCTSREGPEKTRPTLLMKQGFAAKDVGMDFANLCMFTVRHGYTAAGVCTETFDDASSFYFGSPTLDAVPAAPNMRRGELLDTRNDSIQSVELYNRDLPDHEKEMENYLRMSGERFTKEYCPTENCEECARPGWWRGREWLCMGAWDPKKYCEYVNREATLDEMFTDLQGIDASWWIINFVEEANNVPEGQEGALGPYYKNNFLRTLTAMWGGRNRFNNGPMINGKDWNCGMREERNCGKLLDYFQTEEVCEHANIPGFTLFAIQMRHINDYYNSLFDAFTQAQLDINAEAKKFMEHFKPTDGTFVKAVTSILGVLNVIALAALAGSMSAGLAAAGAAVGGVSAVLGGGLAIYEKFTDSEFEQKVQNEDDALEKINLIVNHLRERVTHTWQSLYSGSKEGNAGLYKHTANGVFMNSRVNVDAAVGPIKEAILSQLLPQVWKEKEAVWPVVVFLPNVHNQNKVTINGETWDVTRIFQYRHDFFSPNGTAFSGFLFGIGPTFTKKYEYLKLEGWDEMESKGGITKQRIIESSFASWERKLNDKDWLLTADWLAQNPGMAGGKTPGLYDIPACHYGVMAQSAKIYENSIGWDMCPTYPCC